MRFHFVYATVTLPFIYSEFKDKIEDNKIVVFNDEHYQFFSSKGFNVVKANFNPDKIYNPMNIIKGLIFFSNHILSTKDKYIIIHVYNISFTMVLFFLLRYFLFDSRCVVVVNLTNDVCMEKATVSAKNLLFKMIGFDTEIVLYGSRWYPRLKLDYVDKHFIIGKYDNYPKLDVTEVYEDIDTILLLDDLVSSGFVTEEDLTSFINNVVTILINSGLSVGVKWHPASKRYFGDTSMCKTLPQQTPFELISMQNIKNVIGLNSMCLVVSSKQGVNAISMLDCINFTSSNKNDFKEWLEKESNNKVQFVKQIDDLEGVLVV